MDYDDIVHMRAICKQINIMTDLKNKALELWTTAQINLDNALIDNYDTVPQNYTSKKQLIYLVSKHPEYKVDYHNYFDGKKSDKTATSTLKALESELNCLKKIKEITPE